MLWWFYIDSDSESDEESDNPEEDETELETGESKQGNSQICDHSPCYSKLFLLFYKTKQNYRVPMLVFCTHCRPMVLILLLKKLKTFSACFYWVKETWVKVWKNENCCGNNCWQVFPQLWRDRRTRQSTCRLLLSNKAHLVTLNENGIFNFGIQWENGYILLNF